ncbi:MAG TPA: polyphosphate kinase 2 family protein [Rhodothermales bacterium]
MPSLDVNRYRVSGGKFSLSSVDPGDVQDWKKGPAKECFSENKEAIIELQERLYAEGKQSLLFVFQAMDAGGKDSTIRELCSGINPQGCRVSSFKAPSKEELAHDFLWRIHAQTPAKGMIRIFNRSHYEDVLIVKVHGWAPSQLIEKRYGHINDFERLLTDHGTQIVKVMLHISPEYQLEQFRDRLAESRKWWKFNPDDLTERKRWDEYMEAFETALNRCSTNEAPWYVVPSERKWFRLLVVSQLMRDALERMNPKYPAPSFDPKEWTPERLESGH